MAKIKSIFICANCGYKSPRWQGKCPECNQWNTFEEQRAPVGAVAKASQGMPGKVISLSEVKDGFEGRINSGISEFDTVLGGGIVPGSLILLGGDPGIGKSTLALQAALLLERSGRSVVYVSGEESAQQIKARSQRLGSGKKSALNILAETNLETIVATLSGSQPDIAVMDSIQTLNSEQVNGVVGGVSQLSFATNTLLRLAKEQRIAILLIGHVTKEGMLAGPKTIEHMVDTVLYLEGDRFGNLRLLRSSKNRFGSIGEVGVFDMKESGLVEVTNPSAMFLEHREKPLAGSCITAALEGNKVLLLEIQALTSTSSFGYPKRATSGFDTNRLQLIAAILQKSLKVNLANQDIYVNVAGGFRLDERAVDLPAALAILSSFNGIPLPTDTAAFGEIGLLGEIRGVSQAEKRLRECEKLGFKQVIMGGRPDPSSQKKFPKLKIQNVQSLQDVAEWFK
jgi:DNA repair protein RadA/Sms